MMTDVNTIRNIIEEMYHGVSLVTQIQFLDEVDYGSIILSLHHESHKDRDTLMRVAKDILDQRLQDFWYLVNLNADQIIREAEEHGV